MGLIDGIFGALLNSKNTSDTNDANMRLAKMNNAFNEQMFNAANQFSDEQRRMQNVWNASQTDKQNKWNAEQVMKMFDLNNAYNDPSAQRARLEAAGLNPFMSNISAGIAQSSAASGSAAQGSPASSAAPPRASEIAMQAPPPVQLNEGGFLDLANFLSNKKRNDADVRKTNAEAQNQEIANQYAAANYAAQLDGLILGNNSTKLKNFYQNLQNDILNSTKQSQIDSINLQSKMNQQQFDLNDIQLKAASINLDYLPFEKKLNLAYQGELLSNAIKQGQLTVAQARYQMAAAADMFASAEGKRIDNRQKNAIFNDVVLGVKYDTDIKHSNAKSASWNVLSSKYNAIPNLTKNPFEFIDYANRWFELKQKPYNDAFEKGLRETAKKMGIDSKSRQDRAKTKGKGKYFNYGTGKYHN